VSTTKFDSSSDPVTSLADEIASNSPTLDAAINRLADAVRKGDPKAAAAAAKDVASSIERQVILGRKLAEQCDDPVLKKKILDACDDLENLNPQIVQATKDALMNPNDKEAQQKLERLLEKAKQDNKVINDAAQQMKKQQEEKRKKEQAAAASKQNKEKSEYRADGSRDEIMVAAHTVSNATRNASTPVIPEQRHLLDLAASVAAEMELLSIAAQNNSKKDMIASARKIADMIAKVQSFANDIASKCTDTKLREALLSVCKVPKNFAVQLKIISAVKATSGDDDPTAEAQLVTCAQGLANSVIQTVKAAQAASLKCPRS